MPELLHFTMRSSFSPNLFSERRRKTEGLLRDVMLVTGEFSLTARNKYDDSVYGTAVIEVQGDATGSKDDAIASLISGIKVTDPAFVRFIRTTRKRIADFYQQNCPVIIKKAEVLIDAGLLNEAADYLSIVPETVPCYDEVLGLLQKIGKREPQESPVAPGTGSRRTGFPGTCSGSATYSCRRACDVSRTGCRAA